MSGKKRWNIKDVRRTHAAEIEAIAASLDISSLTAALLCARELDTPEKARAFLQRDRESFEDPFLMRDMDCAVDRILRALEDGERITIYGDYDVDGVTAVSTLYLYLRSKGAKISYYIPERISEGYGVNEGAIDSIAADGTTLIVTVDTGITAVREVEYASSIGVDMVITDHHECHDELPRACAVVNPHRPDCGYPFKELAGVGVAFKLICAIEQTLVPHDGRYLHRLCSEYGDIVAIGTVADVMPLIGENRLIVSIGLRLIEDGSRLGISALCDAASGDGKDQKPGAEIKRKKVTSSFIGYTLAPRLNAAGRIRNASMSVELFLTSDRDRADEIAHQLCEINRERQECENAMAEEAYAMIEQTHDFEHDRVIVLSAEQWHHGVIGIVASRITERYGLPSILISFDGGRYRSGGMSEDDVGKGSGRSVRGMNLAAGLAECREHLVKAGGHEMAAGLSVKRGELESFRRAICNYAASVLSDEDLIPMIDADAEVALSELTLDTVSEFSLLEPYGTTNPVPVFAARDAVLEDISAIGGGKHTRLLLRDEDGAVSAVLFGRSPAELQLSRGDTVDLLFNPDINEFRGKKSVQLIVRDIRICERTLTERETMIAKYNRLMDDKTIMIPRELLPVREDFKKVYLYIRSLLRTSPDDPINIYKLLAGSFGMSVKGYIRLRFTLAVLVQSGILSYGSDPDYSAEGGALPVTVNNMEAKVDLTGSDIYKSLLSRVAP